jgi:putative two-component system response regulator
MTSMRSYRGILPQERVREEIERGRGTQFDPVFADIMLQIMSEDTDYQLRENGRKEAAQ